MRKRTNIYLDDRQLRLLRLLAADRSSSVAELVRAAVDDWLSQNAPKESANEEWRRELGAFLDERQRIADERGFDAEEVDRVVLQAVQEVRRERAARARRR